MFASKNESHFMDFDGDSVITKWFLYYYFLLLLAMMVVLALLSLFGFYLLFNVLL